MRLCCQGSSFAEVAQGLRHGLSCCTRLVDEDSHTLGSEPSTYVDVGAGIGGLSFIGSTLGFVAEFRALFRVPYLLGHL